jgi:thiamine biosynthesis lipoprotein
MPLESTAGVQPVFRTRALGTTAELFVTEPSALFCAAELLEVELRRIDRMASRFRNDSELTALNAASGRKVEVSSDLLVAVGVALSMAEATDGLVDPTVGPSMIRLGYDRDFDEVACGCSGALPAPRAVPGWRCVSVDREAQSVFLPHGISLDLGATAKALTADRAARVIHERLGCGALVSLGGDVSVSGPAPSGGFAVGIADTCTSAHADEAVAISSGGLASSGVGVRHWRLGDTEVHHIVDPSTGLPAETCWRTVTAIAASCVQANTASTAAVVLGEAAPAWLESLSLPARLVHLDGTVRHTKGWPRDAADRGPLQLVAG